MVTIEGSFILKGVKNPLYKVNPERLEQFTSLIERNSELYFCKVFYLFSVSQFPFKRSDHQAMHIFCNQNQFIY
jgi:hypothetical protein